MSVQAEHSNAEANPLELDSLLTVNMMLTAGGDLCLGYIIAVFASGMVFEFTLEKVLIHSSILNILVK